MSFVAELACLDVLLDVNAYELGQFVGILET